MTRISAVSSATDSTGTEGIVSHAPCPSLATLDRPSALGSYHIRKKHSDRMIGDNLESLREYVGEFQPNTMSIHELKELLACPLTPSLASVPSNGTPTQVRQPLPQQPSQPSTNSTHGFRCGYCAFSSANSGDVKKHQTWKHAHLPSNILPIDPNDAAQQAAVSSKRKRVQSTKLTNNDEDGPVVRRPRISMPAQRQLTIDTSAPGNGDYESAPRGLLPCAVRILR